MTRDFATDSSRWPRCGFCGERYYPGDPNGTLFIAYPEGESRFWRHTQTSDRHQALLTQAAHDQQWAIKNVGRLMTEAKAVQKDLAHPLYQILRRILA